MKELEEKLGYSFKDRELMLTALTHSSYANEKQGGQSSYERLEFLGDSILGIITADFLFHHPLNLPEGRMTRLRAELVCEVSLHRLALELGLGQYMRLGKGEEHSGGRERPSILADMVEALIAAIYLDSGIEQARAFVVSKLLSRADIGEGRRVKDYKTQLQEYVQRLKNQSISYVMTGESGPDHNKLFTFCVYINGNPMGEGSGRTKKEAEQMAACRALEAMEA